MLLEFSSFGEKRADADRLLRTALEFAPHPILLEREGVVAYANAAGAKLLGYSAVADVIARPIAELGKASPGPDSEVCQFQFKWNDVPVTVLTTRNVGERRHLEHRLAVAEKMESLGRLVGGVAHDFNSLLTAVTLYTDLLRNVLPPNSAAQRYTEEIRRAAERGGGLIAQLMAFARRQTAEPRPLSINAVLAGMHELLQRLLGPGITLEMRYDDALGKVKADPTQVEQVLLNLAMNARDAMSEGGRLTITTAAARMSSTDLCNWRGTGAQLRPGNFAQIKVRDTGCGMDKATAVHALEPFFTTKQNAGTGLGLTTVNAHVSQLGGSLLIDSTVGDGTTVTILLPLAKVAGRERNTRAMRLPSESETVLLVEPDEIARRATEKALVSCGYKVLAASDGKEAVKAAQRNGSIGLLITNVTLPGDSGEKLARRFAKANAQIPVLYVSAYPPSGRAAAPVDGAMLIRPFRKTALAKRVRQALDAVHK